MTLKEYFVDQLHGSMRQSTRFIVVILLIDLLPLIATIAWGWSAIEALYLYFLETLILLWFTLRKMWRSKYALALFVDEAKNLTENIGKKTKSLKMGFKIPFLATILKGARGLIYVVFMILWIPFLLLQVFMISLASGDGFSFWGFIGHNSGRLDLGLFSINLMLVFMVLLYLEHRYAFKNKFLKNEEYDNTGIINEGVSYSIRVFIQQFIIIGLFSIIGLLHADTITMVIVILIKMIFDVVSYLFNRIWGGLRGKREAQSEDEIKLEITEAIDA